MARANDGTDVPVSPLPASTSKMGSPNGSLPDVEGIGYRASTMEVKINIMFAQVAKMPPLIQSVSRVENCVQTLSQTVASYDAKITNIEQMVSSLAARVTTLETNATSVSSGSGSARSWKNSDIAMAPRPLGLSGPMAQRHLMTVLEQVDGSTAAGSHGPGSSDDNGNTRRTHDTFTSPEDEQSRSAVLPRFPREQYHKGITKWINDLGGKASMPADNRPVTLRCEAGSVSVRLVFETKCQDFIVRFEDTGISYPINSPFCSAIQNIIVRQSKSIEDREIGKQFAPLWRELADQLKILFLDGDDESAFIIPTLDARSHVHSNKDRRNGIGKSVLKLVAWKRTNICIYYT